MAQSTPVTPKSVKSGRSVRTSATAAERRLKGLAGTEDEAVPIPNHRSAVFIEAGSSGGRAGRAALKSQRTAMVCGDNHSDYGSPSSRRGRSVGRQRSAVMRGAGPSRTAMLPYMAGCGSEMTLAAAQDKPWKLGQALRAATHATASVQNFIASAVRGRR